jgi:hypothetical protein
VSDLVIGVLGVLAVAATGALLKWGKQAFAAIRAAVRPDHTALYRTPAWGLMAVQSGGPSRIRLVIACAPSRSLRRARFSPDAAIRLIHRQFPGQFPEQPGSSDVRIGVKFTVSPTGSTEDDYAWAWVTGRIDLSTYIHLEPAILAERRLGAGRAISGCCWAQSRRRSARPPASGTTNPAEEQSRPAACQQLQARYFADTQRNKELCPILGAEWEREDVFRCGQKQSPCAARSL